MTLTSFARSRQVQDLIARVRNWARSPAASGLSGALVVIVVLMPLRWIGAFQPIELAAYDRMLELRGAGAGTLSRVVQINVTESDIKRFRWPISDGVLAEIITRLHADRARAIGIDIFRDTPIPPGSEQLDGVLGSTPDVVWVNTFGSAGEAGTSAPSAARRLGFADIVHDGDGSVRRALLYLDDGAQRSEYSLATALALLYLTAEHVPHHWDTAGDYLVGTIALPRFDSDLGAYRWIDTAGFQILYEFRPPLHVPGYSVGDLVDGKVPADAIANRVVVVGVVSKTVKDDFIAPIGEGDRTEVPGPTMHALLVDQLVAHAMDKLRPTHPLSRDAEFAMLMAVLIAGGLAGVFVPGMIALLVLVFGGAGALLGISWVAFTHAIWLPAALLPGFWVVAIVVSKTAMSQTESTQRAFLMRLFSTHMAAPIARDMWRRRNDFLRHGRPLPVRLDATVLFSDVNDFTTTCEKLEPEEIVRWLDPYMITMVNLIDQHGGCVERFSGDGILAMFGVPLRRETDDEIRGDAVAAVRCALAMAEAIGRLNADYRAAGQAEITFAVGIQSGELVSCSLGSNDRLQYTTMGDTTNTAARLVSVAKDEMKRPGFARSCCIVIGGATRALVGDAFPARPIGPVDLKGKARRTECFALEDARAPVEAAADGFASAPKYGSVIAD